MEICAFSAIYLYVIVMILCTYTWALDPVNLVLCDDTASSNPYCIAHDTTGDQQYLHYNATLSISIKLPVTVLAEIVPDQSKIEIVTSRGTTISRGQEILRSEDRDRWNIEFHLQPVNSDIGKLQIVLRIRDVDYRDEQYLHVEIKSVITTFQTTNKRWIPVEKKLKEEEVETATTTENIMDNDEPSAILYERMETLQNETKALLKKLNTTENYLSTSLSTLSCTSQNDGLEITILIFVITLLLFACWAMAKTRRVLKKVTILEILSIIALVDDLKEKMLKKLGSQSDLEDITTVMKLFRDMKKHHESPRLEVDTEFELKGPGVLEGA